MPENMLPAIFQVELGYRSIHCFRRSTTYHYGAIESQEGPCQSSSNSSRTTGNDNNFHSFLSVFNRETQLTGPYPQDMQYSYETA
jgi:hypothetical protein